MTEQQYPILMTKDFWLNSQLSVARYYGGMRLNGQQYVIAGMEQDLLRQDFLKYYSKLGRERFIAVLKEHPHVSNSAMRLYLTAAIDADRQKAEQRKAEAEKQQMELFSPPTPQGGALNTDNP